jgi:hypothetical protein
MIRCFVTLTLRSFYAAIAGLLFVMVVPAFAHETQEKVEDPGFRPESTLAARFVESVDNASITVYPSIVRRDERTAYSFLSRDQIVASLSKDSTTKVRVSSSRIVVGRLSGRSQWEWFQNGIEAVSREMQRRTPNADYSLAMEFLFPPGNQYVFGVHVYILDRNGENAFSFLLNSHHRAFVEADLTIKDSSEAARTRVIEKATQLGLAALKTQIEQARG